MKSIGINLYGTQFTGDMYLDNMLLWKADGTVDTLESFNKKKPSLQGIATGELIQANTKGEWISAIKPAYVAATSKMLVNVQPGMVTARFSAAKTAPAKAMLMNSIGQVVAQQNFTASRGANTVELSSSYRGPAMLVVRQGSQQLVQKIMLK